MKADIFNAISDADFRIKAFSDYCNDTQQAYQKLLQAETLALEAIPDDPENDGPIDYDGKAEDILNGLGISPNNMLLFNEGYVSSKEYISTLIKGFKETVVDENGSLEDKTVQLKDASGAIVSSVNLDQLCLEVKENLYSLTALCASNAAATIDNTADRIAVFNDKLTSIFQNPYSTVSSTATYLRTMISETSFSSDNYLQNIDALMGISSLAEDNSTNVPNDMDITKFTGANPACALNFNGVFSTIGTVFNVGLKVVGGILKAGAKLVGKIFSKIANFFHKTLVDPYDIEEIDSKANSYTVDGWRYNIAPYNEGTGEGAVYRIEGPIFNNYISNLSHKDIDEYVGKWVKYETIFGELIFKLDRYDIPIDTNPVYSFYPYVQFKPKSLNPDAVYLSAKTVWGETTTGNKRLVKSNGAPSETDLLSFIENLKNQPNLYLTTDANEKKLCLSFHCATQLSQYFSTCAFYEMYNSIATDDTDYSYPEFEVDNIDDWIEHCLTKQVTNIDFVSAASGWRSSTQKYENFSDCPTDEMISWRPTPFPDTGATDVGKYFFLAWILNRADRKVHPLNYTFVPYRNNVDSWNPSRFRIKTDEENRNAFNTLLTVMIVVVVTAVLAITATIVIKKAVRNLYMKRTAAMGVMDNKMWQGQPLTKKEKKKYIRLQRKLNGSTALSSGLQDSANLFSSVSNSVSTVSEDISGISQLTALIKS